MNLTSYTQGGGLNDGLDIEGDQIGVELVTKVICGNCMKEMESTDNISFKCPDCTEKFTKQPQPNKQ